MPAAFDLIRTIYTADAEAREWVDPARQDAIAAIARFVPREQVLALLDVARTVDSPSDRAEVLTTMARCLPPDARARVLDAALEAARMLEDPATRAYALTDLLPLLPPKVRGGIVAEAVDAADAAEALDAVPDGGRTRMWIRLVPHLKGNNRKAALKRARAAAYDESQANRRAFWLAGVACHLSDEKARRVLTDAVDEFTRDDMTWWRRVGEELADLARRLPADLLATLLNPSGVVDLVVSESDRLSAVAPHLPAELLDLALAAARTLNVAYGDRAKAIASLLPRFSGTFQERARQEALDAASAIDEPAYRATAFTALLPHFTSDDREPVLNEALHAARATTERDSRARALIALVPHAPTDIRPALCAETLDAARGIPNDRSVDVMTELAPHLPEPLRSEVRAESVAVARTINFPSTRAWVAYRMARTAQRDRPPDYAAVRAAIDLASGVGRNAVVEVLAAAFDDPTIMKAVHTALEDTQRWWN
jgi:hypothetical protein